MVSRFLAGQPAACSSSLLEARLPAWFVDYFDSPNPPDDFHVRWTQRSLPRTDGRRHEPSIKLHKSLKSRASGSCCILTVTHSKYRSNIRQFDLQCTALKPRQPPAVSESNLNFKVPPEMTCAPRNYYPISLTLSVSEKLELTREVYHTIR